VTELLIGSRVHRRPAVGQQSTHSRAAQPRPTTASCSELSERMFVEIEGGAPDEPLGRLIDELLDSVQK
jgi:hypothetical protein